MPYPAHPLPPKGRPPRARGGFTLVELLAVIAIVGVLAAIVIPVVGSVRETARAGTCVSNLRQIGTATQLFASEYKGILPGIGKTVPTASASWHDVLNARVFGSRLGSLNGTLQRSGDTPVAGQIYCPSMQPFGTAVRGPRAYGMNTYTVDQNLTSNPRVVWGDVLDYQKGLPVARFSTPARTVLVLESERSGDLVQPTAPFGQITPGDGTGTPAWSANSEFYAFRHKGRMNVLFMDGHVESLDTQAAARINTYAAFQP